MILVAITIAFMGGILLGKLHERIEWNKLIQSGILPKPKKG